MLENWGDEEERLSEDEKRWMEAVNKHKPKPDREFLEVIDLRDPLKYIKPVPLDEGALRTWKFFMGHRNLRHYFAWTQDGRPYDLTRTD